jgi:hypothetical protein
VTNGEADVRGALEAFIPLRSEAQPDWTRVLARAIETAPKPRWTRRKRVAFAVALAAVALTAPVLAIGATQNWWLSHTGGTVPEPVFVPIHGRPAGWARSGSNWFVVYVKGGTGRCGLDGGHWRIALVETRQLPARIVADHAIGGSMCGNLVSWVKTGRFSDGKHAEAAFQLWTTPAIGATTYVYRLGGGKLTPLARFPGDDVELSPGTVTVTYENVGRSAHGETKDVYRYAGGRYKLVGRS